MTEPHFLLWRNVVVARTNLRAFLQHPTATKDQTVQEREQYYRHALKDAEAAWREAQQPRSV